MRFLRTLRHLLLASWLATLAGAICSAQTPELGSLGGNAGADSKLFELSVRPLLIQHCISCHGPDKSEGGLRLDLREGLIRGGDSGPLIAESADDSLLLRAIQYEGPEMPPSHPLPDDQVEAMARWIREGAHWPEYAESIFPVGTHPKAFTDEDRSYWLFQPLRPIAPPISRRAHPIDAFVEEKLAPLGLAIASSADARILVRRVFLDLVGMPPTWSELEEFLTDEPEGRYERLIERLLDDPRYGERWGRYWLDLVRFAESDGFKQDAFRPSAYRYRDYVIQAFNADKPYSQFVIEQLAGDELDANPDEMNAATGYLRHWIYEYNQRDVRGQWDNILNDLTDVSGEVFLGLGFSCARCHDHKFDPILQSDYYRLQAFFAPLEPRYDVPSSQKEFEVWRTAHQAWLQQAQPILERKGKLESEVRQAAIDATIEKFPPDVRPALRKPPEARAPHERQIAELAYLQIGNDLNGIDYSKKLTGEVLEEWKRLKEQLDELKKSEPKPPEMALTVRDIGPLAPQTRVPGRDSLGAIEPGPPAILVSMGASGTHWDSISTKSNDPSMTTGRRLQLAHWIAHPENPLSWRTIANRVWQHHFGRGIVVSTSDMGRLSEAPSHPELLDWLAQSLIESGGSLKKLHYLIMTSDTYQQVPYSDLQDTGMMQDPENRFLWRFQPRRMDAEQIRDAILLASGDYDARMGGPSDSSESNRRSIYQRALRNSPHAMLATFDAPDGNGSVAKRNPTTTSLQALYMTNSEWPLNKAESLAKRLTARGQDVRTTVLAAYRTVLLREPSVDELQMAIQFLTHGDDNADVSASDSHWIDFCHALFNTNEFLYVE